MYLTGYNFKIYYQKDITNLADASSKRPDYDKSDKPQDLAWLPTFQNKLKGSFVIKWIKDKEGLDGEHSPKISFGQSHYNSEGLLRYNNVGMFAVANSWAPGQECQISHNKEVIENECVYLAYGC
jgi:hypothetical protein